MDEMPQELIINLPKIAPVRLSALVFCAIYIGLALAMELFEEELCMKNNLEKNGTDSKKGLISTMAGGDKLKQTFADKEKKPPTVTINKPVREVYSFFRNFSNLPKFMNEFTTVTAVTDKLAKWSITGDSAPEEWETEIFDEKADELLQWRSVEGAKIKQTGTLWLRPDPGGRGTIVSLKVSYEKTPNALTEGVLKLVGQDGDTQTLIHLRKLKAFMETGEIPTVEGQPTGDDEIDTIRH